MAPHGDGRMDGDRRGGGQPAGAGRSTKQVPPLPEGHLGGTSQATGDVASAGARDGLMERGCRRLVAMDTGRVGSGEGSALFTQNLLSFQT